MHPIYTFLLIAPLLVGCSTFESSTYENRSTKDGNVVTATGKAADVAAGANTSHNCPSCAADETSSEPSPASSQKPSKVEESQERIVESAADTLTNEISQEVNQTIRDIFD